MLARFHPKLTYANVISTLCLFMLLGGGAYAATSFIGSDGQVHGCVSTTGQLTVLKPGKKCAKHMTAIAWNQRGPAGDNGQQGPQGPQGTQGIQGIQGIQGQPGPASPAQVVERTTAITTNIGAQATIVSCNSGEHAVSGGVGRSNPTAPGVNDPVVHDSEPSGSGWYVDVSFPGGSDSNQYYWLICVKP